MSCNYNENCNSCIYYILKKILLLQKQDFDNDNYIGCDKPYLGPITTSVCYNTRPLMLYICCTGNPWSFTATVNSESVTSNIFRVENCDDCCCTCRLLTYNSSSNQYTSTNEFVTIDLSCCGAIKCLSDTYVDLCA